METIGNLRYDGDIQATEISLSKGFLLATPTAKYRILDGWIANLKSAKIAIELEKMMMAKYVMKETSAKNTDVCPYCNYRHNQDEGSSEQYEGVCYYTCEVCQKTYFAKE